LAVANPAPATDKWFFPTEPGTMWLYRGPKGMIDVILKEVERNREGTLIKLFEKSSQGSLTPRESLSLRQDGVYRVSSGNSHIERPLCILKTPFEPGRRWSSALRTDILQILDERCTPVMEDVEVPSGKYRAIRCDWVERIRFKGADEQVNRQTEWYARGIGLVKESFQGTVTELVKFSHDPKSTRP
jgi:hypothetical protein